VLKRDVKLQPTLCFKLQRIFLLGQANTNFSYKNLVPIFQCNLTSKSYCLLTHIFITFFQPHHCHHPSLWLKTHLLLVVAVWCSSSALVNLCHLSMHGANCVYCAFYDSLKYLDKLFITVDVKTTLPTLVLLQNSNKLFSLSPH